MAASGRLSSSAAPGVSCSSPRIAPTGGFRAAGPWEEPCVSYQPGRVVRVSRSGVASARQLIRSRPRRVVRFKGGPPNYPRSLPDPPLSSGSRGAVGRPDPPVLTQCEPCRKFLASDLSPCVGRRCGLIQPAGRLRLYQKTGPAGDFRADVGEAIKP